MYSLTLMVSSYVIKNKNCSIVTIIIAYHKTVVVSTSAFFRQSVNNFTNLYVTLFSPIIILIHSEESWLAQGTGASSFCTGCGTAEMSRTVLQKVVNESGKVEFTMDIPTLACWDSWDLKCTTFFSIYNLT